MADLQRLREAAGEVFWNEDADNHTQRHVSALLDAMALDKLGLGLNQAKPLSFFCDRTGKNSKSPVGFRRLQR
jgi:hypothetical protein